MISIASGNRLDCGWPGENTAAQLKNKKLKLHVPKNEWNVRRKNFYKPLSRLHKGTVKGIMACLHLDSQLKSKSRNSHPPKKRAQSRNSHPPKKRARKCSPARPSKKNTGNKNTISSNLTTRKKTPNSSSKHCRSRKTASAARNLDSPNSNQNDPNSEPNDCSNPSSNPNQ
ncbi:hypothetical protein PtA15_3A364 [Puccinia triticina]|uniref:Uncharacterized protein n=1 Tax=Puccinia triticina TaxID=208348 RepID=A0ABY7CDJ9_9BASI|nr:uncharacterized protein PtA15_3A364 [Puccinia triticina]WAQ82998.1 hypothetical protein PtA15_3A364 [Puccinia triticina]